MILSLGIDVSKSKLDVYLNGKSFEVNNDSKSIQKSFSKIDRTAKIVMEATGKYHRVAHQKLFEMGFSVMIINPYQSRHFAKSMNILCKTDAVDAKILAMYAQRMDFKETPPSSKIQLELQELSRHLSDLKKMQHGTNMRLEGAEGYLKKSLKRILKSIETEIAEVEEKLKSIILDDEVLRNKLMLLKSIPGVGDKTALMLLSCLKELGTLKKTEISALSGLAPINQDSGTMRGKRRIKGGRYDVRAGLYMPIVGAATIHNSRLKVIHDRLVGAGKMEMVALVACMRKLVIWANAILASGEPWRENHA